MKIAAAQIRPVAGDINENLEIHLAMVETCINHGVDLVVFPELSLTGYEPRLAKELVSKIDRGALTPLQELSDKAEIYACLGLPTYDEKGIKISMIILRPQSEPLQYSKRFLHEDELPYFTPGDKQLFFEVKGKRIFPAICYESLLPEHASEAVSVSTDIYMASVAKHERGVGKAYARYGEIAAKHGMAVIMSNSVGPCDNFVGAGQSAVWRADGTLAGRLRPDHEGILIYDTDTEIATSINQETYYENPRV